MVALQPRIEWLETGTLCLNDGLTSNATVPLAG
jgi:hypothetical protein